MANSHDAKWKKFEKVVYDIQKELAPDSEVKLDDAITGEDSKVSRQIDISIRRNIGQYSILIVIDCKDYGVPIDVKDLGEFATLVKDVRAHKGAMISSKGFTPAAVSLAKARGIDTFTLIDTESVDWKAYATIPVLLRSTNLKSFRVIYKNFQILPREIVVADHKKLKLYSQQQKFIGTIGRLVLDKWNNKEIEHASGEHEVLLSENIMLEINSQKFGPLDVAAVVLVEEHTYFSDLPVHLKGFHDAQKGGVITKSFETDKIWPAKIEQGLVEGWRELKNPTELSIQPLLEFYVYDSYPKEEVE